jgi:D-alanyl-D-alanine carboxypeptidase
MNRSHIHKRWQPTVPAIVMLANAAVIGTWLGASSFGPSLAWSNAAAAAPAQDRIAVTLGGGSGSTIDSLTEAGQGNPEPRRPDRGSDLSDVNSVANDAPPACRIADDVTTADPDGDWTLAVLDTDLRLPKGYAPRDLVAVARAGLSGGDSVRAIVLVDLRDLAAAARAAHVPLAVRSAYRSEAYQAQVFAGWVHLAGERSALRSSARPGHSEHQLGTTIDFATGRTAPWSGTFAKTKTGRWLALHGSEFGFVMSYPAGGIARTCYAAEPWHFRWVGRVRARAVAASGLTLREWLSLGSVPEIGLPGTKMEPSAASHSL